jgi:hypothetical protein
LNNIRGHLYKKYKELGGILASEQAKEADELVKIHVFLNIFLDF